MLQDMIETHTYYKEILNDDEVIMRIWHHRDNRGEHYFIFKLGSGKE